MRSRATISALTCALLGACFAPDPARLCQDAAGCEKGAACIVGRCRASADAVLSATSRRIVLAPTDIAVLSSNSSARLTEGTIPLGRATLGDVVLLLRFDAGVGDAMEVESAFLTLHPGEHAAAPGSPVSYSVTTVGAPWESSALTWARQPPLGVPENAARLLGSGRSSLRIDVTRLFRASDGLANGVALLARGDDPIGAEYATGLGTGAPPELELYLMDKNPSNVAVSALPSTSAAASGAPSATSSVNAPDAGPPRKKRPSEKKLQRPRP